MTGQEANVPSEAPPREAIKKNGVNPPKEFGHGAGDAESKSSAPELPPEEMSFAEMFELAEKQSAEKRRTSEAVTGLRPGQVIEASVVGFSHDQVFVDVGGKAEGMIPKIELLEQGELKVKEGDSIEARVRKFENGAVVLAKVLAHQSIRNRNAVREAFDAGISVEGVVKAQNKGGFEVEIFGLRAFCPTSQIDIRFNKDEDFIGRKLRFKLLEFKDSGRNIVVSRKVILEEERKEKAIELFATLKEGDSTSGLVTSVQKYGAFVDIGGVEGLIHLTELAHGHVRRPSEMLSFGQRVEVKVLKIEDLEGKPDWEKKISLSLKALTADPWVEAQSTLKVGDKVRGKVARIQAFGAFVEIMEGVDGLIHLSNMSNERIRTPKDVVSVGDEVEATVINTDWSGRRIGLSLVKTKQELANELSVGKAHEGTIEKIESFGLFVKLPTGARGLVPTAETGTERGTDLKKHFQKGQTVKVSVVDIEKKSGKIRLSIRRALEAEERAEIAGYLNQGNKSGGGLGTLGDLLKGRLADFQSKG